MPTLSVSVPQTLRERMAKLDEVNWSAVARKAFEEKTKEMEAFKQFVHKAQQEKMQELWDNEADDVWNNV